MGKGDKPTVLDYRAADKPATEGDRVVAWLGGGRQIVFALGFACLMLGLGASISRFFSDGAYVMAFGGLVVGLAYPLPRRNPPTE